MKNKKIDLSDLIGKPFKYYGRGPRAFDCYGLIKEVLNRAGYELPDKKTFIEMRLRNDALQKGREYVVELSKPEPYCIVAFRVEGPLVGHVGVVLEDINKFIHIQTKKRCCIEKLDHPLWRSRIEGYYKVKELIK